MLGGRIEPGPVISETRRLPPRGQGHVRAVTTTDHKLIHWITLDRYELFDIGRDPLEHSPRQDRDGMRPLGELLAEWEQAHALADEEYESHSPAAGRNEDLRELDRQLRGLGYAE
jgi:hypothetical protein